MIRLEVTRGQLIGKSIESAEDNVRIGRASDSDLALPDDHVSSDHARIVYKGERYMLVDLRSTNGTALVRGAGRIALVESNGREAALDSGDVIELGSGEELVRLNVTVTPDKEDATVLAVRRVDDIEPATTTFEKDGRLRMIYEAQKRIGATGDLIEVLGAISDATFELVPKATHVTLILREDDEDGGTQSASGYVPIMTRIRGQTGPSSGPIPVTRSVFRKVVSERAAVIAADATREVGQTESLLGASIRSVLGVPLWRGDEMLGVLQVDNRESTGVFTSIDLDVSAVLGHHASLAVANARLVQRLRVLEDARGVAARRQGRSADRRSGAGHARALRPAREGGRHARHGPHRGRDGRRQGAHRGCGSLPVAQAGQALREPELRSDA
jgi:pSer/pThr/pTyr-binding forkhead associated (FHA) protein